MPPSNSRASCCVSIAATVSRKITGGPDRPRRPVTQPCIYSRSISRRATRGEMVGMKLMRAAVAGACAACVALPGTALAGTLDQQQPNGEGASLQIQNTQSLAQTFTAGLTGGLDQVDLKLSGTGPTQPLIVEIRNSAAGSPGGTVLASGSIPTSAAPAVTAFLSPSPPPTATGQRAAALKKCKKKRSKAKRRKCRKKARKLPV